MIGAALADTDEAAWHLACGADEPDELLAARVEQAAEHAAGRGATARAASLAKAAVELTPDPDSLAAWRRRVAWLKRLDTACEFDQVRGLAEKWAESVPARVPPAQLTAVRAGVEPDVEAACDLFTVAFEDLAGHDPARAAQVGAQIGSSLGILLGRLDEARPYIRLPRIGQARAAGDPVTCARQFRWMDSWPRWRAIPAREARCRLRCGSPGSPRHHLRISLRRLTLPSGISGVANPVRRVSCCTR